MRLPKLKASIVGLLLALLFSCPGAQGAEIEIKKFNFDEELPGSWPQNWSFHWGSILDGNRLYVTNIDSVSKKNCLVVYGGPSGLPSSQFGFGYSFKDITNDWAVYSFCFKLNGSGSAFDGLGFRVMGWIKATGKTEPVASPISFGGKRVRFKDSIVGIWEEDVWHKLTLWFPTKGGGQKEAHALLKRQTRDLTWEEVAPRITIPSAPTEANNRFEFVVSGNNFTAFFDDLTVSTSSTLD